MNNQNNNRPPMRNVNREGGYPNPNRMGSHTNARPDNSGRPMYNGNVRNTGSGAPGQNRTQYTNRNYNASQMHQRPQNGTPGQTSQNVHAQYPPVRHISRKQARKNSIILGVTCTAIVLLLISIVILAARCTVGLTGIGSNGLDGTSEAPDTLNDTTAVESVVIPETEPPETEPEIDPNFEYIEMSASDIHKGYQILVNYENAYDFGDYFDFKTLYSAKNGLYKVTNVSDSIDKRALDAFVAMMSAFGDATGNSDIIVTSADRTYEFQEQLYRDRVDMYGEEYARLYVAEPGHSEHHTGLALDLAIYTDGGRGYTFDDKPEYGEWMRSNSYKFGFIERYQAAKTPITKIAYENWHYRYIGKPHAYYMVTNDLCLEEYIELLRDHELDSRILITDDEGAYWEVYYVPAVEGDTVKIPVPKYFDYEISGNNVDGFIVTVNASGLG